HSFSILRLKTYHQHTSRNPHLFSLPLHSSSMLLPGPIRVAIHSPSGNHVNCPSLHQGFSSVPSFITISPRFLSSTISTISIASFLVPVTSLLRIIPIPSPSFPFRPIMIHELLQMSCSNQPFNLILQMPAMTTSEVVTQFRGYNPEKFSGQGDPRLVEEWIQGLETIFEITECTERQHIICAQLQMTGDARLWWNSYWGMRPGEKENLTWMQFKEMMEEKYYPTHYRVEMERQFLALSQGNRTVDEYEREFTRLGSFVKYLVDTEAKKARRFQDGLQQEI
ncbi:Unknown protein, partial [Striga hermonthica]